MVNWVRWLNYSLLWIYNCSVESSESKAKKWESSFPIREWHFVFPSSYPFLFSSSVSHFWEVVTFLDDLVNKIQNMQNQKAEFWRHREASAFMFIKAIRPFIYLDVHFVFSFFKLILTFCMKFQNSFGEISEERGLALSNSETQLSM